MFHDGSQCFASVSRCFMMFNNVLRCLVCRDRRAMIGIDDCTISNRCIGDCLAANCRRDMRYRRESDPMLNSILNGDRSNSVTGRQFIPEVLQVFCDVLQVFHDV